MAELKRALGATELISNVQYQDGAKPENGFDSKKPWSDIKEVTDSLGNVWISIPKFYTKYVMDESGAIKERYVSEFNGGSGWHLNPIFRNSKGKEINNFFISKYLLSLEEGKLVSKAGLKPYGGVACTTARTLIESYEDVDYNYEYSSFDIWALMALQDLAIVEFAETGTNKVMQGITFTTYSNTTYAENRKSGKTDMLTSASGSAARSKEDDNGLYACRYRLIENLWGNGRLFVDGIYCNDAKVFCCKNSSNYSKLGEYTLTNITKPLDNGLVHQLTFDTEHLITFPKSLSTAGSYDNYYEGRSSAGNKVVYLGAEGSGGKNGLYSYIITVEPNSALPYNTFKMIKKEDK